VATEAMKHVLKEYRPNIVTYDDALNKAIAVVNSFVERENEKNNIQTLEIEINDYP